MTKNFDDEQENEQLTKKEMQKTFSKFLQEDEIEDEPKLFKILVPIIIIVIIGTFIAFNFFSIDLSNLDFQKFNISNFFEKHNLFKNDKQSLGETLFNKHQNILILGVDSNGKNADPFDGTRSDTILVMSIYPKTKTVNILSIPRDSKVYIAHNKGVQKINAAHALGGINLTKDTIEETFGFKINNYIVFNTEGVREFVDAIGGLPIYVEKDMRYHDYTAGLHIDLTKGTHMLDGKTAEGFLRFRKDALGDIGRTARQQWFLRALAERIKDPEVLPKIPAALKVIDKYVKSDLSLYQLSQYAAFATSIDMSKVETATLPGAPNKRGYTSYWILDPAECRDVINRMICILLIMQKKLKR
jgi:LCP family protein required for cell wall assembly